jgi:hypothetical protein
LKSADLRRRMTTQIEFPYIAGKCCRSRSRRSEAGFYNSYSYDTNHLLINNS